MKKLLLILSLIITIGFNQQSKAQVNHLFWAHNNNEFAGNGLLYNWYAVTTANFAPTGWHVPTSTELIALQTNLGGESIAGGKLKLTGILSWNSPNTGATNEVLFNSMGSGSRVSSSGGVFTGLKIRTIYSASNTFGVYCYEAWLYNTTSTFPVLYDPKADGRSVRLIKDDSTDPSTLTDYDGNIYKTVKIGTQVWIASNWKCTKLNDGTVISEVTDNATWAALTTGAWCYYNNNPKYK